MMEKKPQNGRLVLTWHRGEAIYLGEDIVLESWVKDSGGGQQIRICINAPKSVKILRQKLKEAESGSSNGN